MLLKRLLAGATMLIGFVYLICQSSQALIYFVMLLQAKVFQELRRARLTDVYIQDSKTQQLSDWWLFFIFLTAILHDNMQSIECTSMISVAISQYIVWFVWWIYTLNTAADSPRRLASCILHTSWVHLSIFYTLSQPIIISKNVAEGGLFWFFFPCSLVICNDIAAYFCGKYYGKRMLTQLSPNKTLEGYIGAIFVTVIYGYVAAILLSKIEYLTQDTDLANRAIYDDIGYHGVVVALFASIIAPFAGFFASAVKRAAGLKDFDQFIPGHGGLTDRLDCQLFMAIFTYFYCQSIISQSLTAP